MLAIQKEHFCFLRKLRLNIEDDLYGYEGAQLCNSLSDNVITLTAGSYTNAWKQCFRDGGTCVGIYSRTVTLTCDKNGKLG